MFWNMSIIPHLVIIKILMVYLISKCPSFYHLTGRTLQVVGCENFAYLVGSNRWNGAVHHFWAVHHGRNRCEAGHLILMNSALGKRNSDQAVTFRLSRLSSRPQLAPDVFLPNFWCEKLENDHVPWSHLSLFLSSFVSSLFLPWWNSPKSSPFSYDIVSMVRCHRWLRNITCLECLEVRGLVVLAKFSVVLAENPGLDSIWWHCVNNFMLFMVFIWGFSWGYPKTDDL